MEDDKLTDLFENFHPELSPDSLFMSKLKRNIKSVEIIKQHTAALRKRTKIAVGVATLVGFVTGMAMTLLMPITRNPVPTFAMYIPNHGFLNMDIDWQIVGWILTAVVCVFSAINGYEITMARLSTRKLYT